MSTLNRLRPRLAAAVLLCLSLVVAPAGVAQATGGDTAAPVVPQASGAYFQIVSPVFNRCLDSMSNGLLREIVCKNNDAQLWAPTVLVDNTVQWQNRSGFCLEAPSSTPGVRLVQAVCNHNSTGQKWSWGFADFIGHLVLQSAYPNMCMAFDSSTGLDGRPVFLWDCATVASEFWRIDA